MQIHLNVDQWVMARDRHRLNRLRKDKKTQPAEIEKLFEQSYNTPGKLDQKIVVKKIE